MLKEQVFSLLLDHNQSLDPNEVQLALIVVSKVDPFIGSQVALLERSTKFWQPTYLYYGTDKKEATTQESLYKRLGVKVTLKATELEVNEEAPRSDSSKHSMDCGTSLHT